MRLRYACGLILTVVLASTVEGGIVHNSGASDEDQLAISFQLLNSSGAPVAAASGDKYSLVVWYPDGTTAYTETNQGVLTSPNVTSASVSLSGVTIGNYAYAEEVADLDGSGVSGTYKYTFVVWDSSADLYSTYNGEFQLYTTTDFSTAMDSSRFADVIRINGDATAAQFVDAAFDAAMDSTAVLDLKQLRLVGSKNDGVTEAPLFARNWGGGYTVSIEGDTTGVVTNVQANVEAGGSGYDAPGGGAAVRLIGGGTGAGLLCYSKNAQAIYVRPGSSFGDCAYIGSTTGEALYLSAHAGNEPTLEIVHQGSGPALSITGSYANDHGTPCVEISTLNDSAAVRIASPSGVIPIVAYGSPFVDSTWMRESARRAIGREVWETDTNSTATGGWQKTSGGGSEQFGDWTAKAGSGIALLDQDRRVYSILVVDTMGGEFASITGATLTVLVEGSGEIVQTCSSIENGLVQIEVPSAGTYDLRLSKDGYTFEDVQVYSDVPVPGLIVITPSSRSLETLGRNVWRALPSDAGRSATLGAEVSAEPPGTQQ